MSQTAFPSELLSQSVTQRLDYFKACTIAHSRLQEVAQELRDAMREPAGELIVFLYGPTGVGKTTVLSRCMQQIIEERREEMENDPSWIPVLGVEAISPERGRASATMRSGPAPCSTRCRASRFAQALVIGEHVIGDDVERGHGPVISARA